MSIGKQSSYSDTFIREVRAVYHPTGTRRFKLTDSEDTAAFVRSVLPDNSREHFVALYLDGSHQVVSYSIVATGTANKCTIHPREILQRAILAGAVSLVVAHNHPSGDTSPSVEDVQMTRRLCGAAELCGIPLLDHVIVTDLAHESIRYILPAGGTGSDEAESRE